MTRADEIWFVLTFGGVFFGLAFISVVGQIYLVLFRMEAIFRFLSNSQGVLVRKPLSGGVTGAYFMLACIGSYLLMPSRAIKGGALDESDFLSFPKGLLRLIRYVYLSAIGSFVVMVVFLLVANFMGWLE
ncbi:hypothetical protein [Pseudomonas sp. B26(2017)]|uniref:hypothetical protein n=1 Tax=Pseudomonas sp. B26(2017) TaxID=1981732 RepID=UPI000A1ED03A|nr:hypothetical protein [Pseudomonas sp. B26(2017)]